MLSHQIEISVRFNEADPLGIVWHGHYVRYFEDCREAFGKTHGISYLDFYANNLVVPIVSIHCEYKKPLRYGDTIAVHAFYKPTVAAKLIFEYQIFDAGKNELVATGSSTQVFVDAKTFQLQLVTPEFFRQWKEKMKLH